jgi:glycerol-3-phosphate acyltransferase PlsX
MVSSHLKQGYTANLFTRLAALISMPVLKSFRRKFDPRRYNGASLLGLQGIVVKSHGGADSLAYANAIGMARTEIIKQVPQRIHKQLENLLAQRPKA